MVRFIVDPVFYFYMFWIPKYLVAVRGVSLQRAGEVAWIPFLALGISNVAGGWVSDQLIRAGKSVAGPGKRDGVRGNAHHRVGFAGN